jgi:hypothetical protein
MKAILFPLVSAAAAAAAVALFPFHPLAAGLLFTADGVIVMLAADYGRRIEPVRVRAEVVGFEQGRASAALGRAA